jgi:hypothetical protein
VNPDVVDTGEDEDVDVDWLIMTHELAFGFIGKLSVSCMNSSELANAE